MKLGIQALLSASTMAICLAVVGCNPEEAPPATPPPPAATAPGAPGEAPKPEATPKIDEAKGATPAPEPAKAP